MFIIYRGLGLIWGGLGILILPVVFLATGSLGVALIVLASFWIFIGRGNFEPRWGLAPEEQGKRPSPAVFFIPIWVFGLLIAPIALTAIALEIAFGRVSDLANPARSNDRIEGELPSDSGYRRFEAANKSISSSRSGVAYGNSELAIALAQDYSALLKGISEAAFTGGKEGLLSTTDHQFVVYCHVNEGESVAFLVHVPELRQYKGEVREALSHLCWISARKLIRDSGAPESVELAVALRGTLLYGPIMIDQLVKESTTDDRNKDELHRFFQMRPDIEITNVAQNSGTVGRPNDPPSERDSNGLSDSNDVSGTDSSPSDGPPTAPSNMRSGTAERTSTPSSTVTSLPLPITPPAIAPRPTAPALDGPGVPVTADTELGPGQKLAGYWGGIWSQVVVTGFQGDDVLTAWVHSNSWTQYRMIRSHLRLVTDEEFALCKKSYNEVPVQRTSLADDVELTPGKNLLCLVENYWLPVEVMGSESDQGIPIHWTGFSKNFDEHVTRDRLALANIPQTVFNVPSTSPQVSRPSQQDTNVPGHPVLIDTKLRPGQKLAGNWGREWYQVVVTGFRGKQFVLTAWVHSNHWTTYAMLREQLRLVTDDEFEACLQKYSDTPKPPESISEDVKLEVGTKLSCEVSGFWLPIVVADSEKEGNVLIHWENFPEEFDETVSRNRLYYRLK